MSLFYIKYLIYLCFYYSSKICLYAYFIENGYSKPTFPVSIQLPNLVADQLKADTWKDFKVVVYKVLPKLNTMQFYNSCNFLLLLKALLVLEQLELKYVYKRNVFGHFSFLIPLSPARDPQLPGASAASHFHGKAGVLSCSTIAGPSHAGRFSDSCIKQLLQLTGFEHIIYYLYIYRIYIWVDLGIITLNYFVKQVKFWNYNLCSAVQ